MYGQDETKLDQAAEAAKKAVQLQYSALNLNILSWIYHKKGRYSLAEEAIQRAIALDPTNLLYNVACNTYKNQTRIAESHLVKMK